MKKINTPKKYIFQTSVFLFAVLFGGYIVHGSECDQLTGDDKLKCEDLEQKAEAYRNLIEIKNKQQNTLQNQMELIDKQQEKNKIDMEQTKTKTDDLARQISDLEREIDDKDDAIRYQKSILSGLVRSYYENYQQGVLQIVLIDKNFSDMVNPSDYVEQSGLKVTEVLSEIRQVKQALEEKQQALDQKKYDIEMLKNQLENKDKDLQNNEIQKQSLLAQTQGEEDRYRKLLERVENQKKELFDFSQAGNLDEVIASVNNYPKPDSKYWASGSWYYSQRDSRWGSSFIGNSRSILKDYGCALSSVAMVSTYYGNNITPQTLAKQPIYSFDLINWNLSGWKSATISVDPKYGNGHGNINWKVVDEEIQNGNPIIVNIRKTNGKGGHYVVIHHKDKNDYIVHDPYFGPNIYLNTSRALMGNIGDKSSTVVDQMIIYKK